MARIIRNADNRPRNKKINVEIGKIVGIIENIKEKHKVYKKEFEKDHPTTYTPLKGPHALKANQDLKYHAIANQEKIRKFNAEFDRREAESLKPFYDEIRRLEKTLDVDENPAVKYLNSQIDEANKAARKNKRKILAGKGKRVQYKIKKVVRRK